MKGLVTLGVLDSIVGEMANVTVGCLGVWTKNVIVPLALVKKATETEAKYYDAFDRYMAECFHQGRKTEKADTAHAVTEHVPAAMQVVEQASDVQVEHIPVVVRDDGVVVYAGQDADNT
jgi:hypothetical protein